MKNTRSFKKKLINGKDHIYFNKNFLVLLEDFC